MGNSNNAVTVHDRAEMSGERHAMLAMQPEREAATIALANRPGYDIATITDQEFEQGLERLKVRQQRMQKVLDTALTDGIHYGNPNNAFPKPMLLQPGVEELIKLFRLSPRHGHPPIIESSETFVSVTVMIEILDSMGRLLAARSGSCNTMEKRFRGRGGNGFTFKDAREMLHNCQAMAEKRALKFAVSAATGATAFFANEEEMAEALAEDVPEPTPWTDDERKAVQKAAVAAGLKTRDDLKAFVSETLGREFVGTGEDVATLIMALKKRQIAAEKAAAKAPANAPAPAAATADTGDLPEEDDGSLPF